MKTFFLLGAISSGVAGLAAPAAAMSPPQYVYWGHLKATLGGDPCIKVNDLVDAGDGHYGLRLDVCDAGKAKALNTVLKRAESALVAVEVAGPDHQPQPSHPGCTLGQAAEVAALFRAALAGNRFVAGVTADEGAAGPMVWVEFRPAVVQVWVDDLGDRFGNVNYVAADAFGQVLSFASCGPRTTVRGTTSRLSPSPRPDPA